MESEETSSPLLGRSAELSTLMRLLQRVRSGAPASAFVEGEPGIGKTRLFDETLKRASGFSVFSAHCEEMLRDRPFGPLAEALRIDYRSNHPVRS